MKSLFGWYYQFLVSDVPLWTGDDAVKRMYAVEQLTEAQAKVYVARRPQNREIPLQDPMVLLQAEYDARQTTRRNFVNHEFDRVFGVIPQTPAELILSMFE